MVLTVPHFTASHANTGGGALRSAGFLSYTRIQAGFGESSPTRCLQIHQVKFPHAAGRLAGRSGLMMSFTPPTAVCWGYPCRLNQTERMQAHLEGAPWPAQGLPPGALRCTALRPCHSAAGTICPQCHLLCHHDETVCLVSRRTETLGSHS